MELKSKTGRIRAITAIIILAAIILTITNPVITNANNAKETSISGTETVKPARNMGQKDSRNSSIGASPF